MQLDGVGGGTAASGSGALFSGEKVAMQLRCVGSRGRDLDIELQVADGWHINANPASLDFLVPTRLSVYEDERPLSVETSYPEAHTIPAEELQQGPIDVYSDTVRIRSRLPDSVSDNNRLTVVLEIQACNDKGRCLAPDKLEEQIPEL